MFWRGGRVGKSATRHLAFSNDGKSWAVWCMPNVVLTIHTFGWPDGCTWRMATNCKKCWRYGPKSLF